MFLAVLKDAYACLGRRLPILVTGMLVASLLDGIGLTMLLPLLAQFGISREGGQPNQLAQAIDHVLSGLGIPAALGPLMAVIVSILLLQVAATFFVKWYQTRCTTFYTAYWRRRLFQAVMGADWSYLLRSKADAQANVIMNESSRISAALSLLLQMISSLFFIAVYAVISLLAAWQIVAFLVVFGMGVYLVTRPLSHRGKLVGEQVTQVSENLFRWIREFLQNAKLIKATATERTAIATFNQANEDYRKTYHDAGVLPAVIYAIYMGSGYVVMGFGIWFAVTHADIAPAAIIVSIYIFMRLYTQLSNFQQLRQSFILSAAALPSAQREFQGATAAAEHAGEGAVLTAEGAVDISVHDLSVKYGEHTALSGVSVQIPAGSVVGLTGLSGAGKSTFVDAIVGLIAPASGTVQIDGRQVSAFNPRDWRHHIGYVAQETLLLHGTIAENIAWGKKDTALEDIHTAARLAGAHDFIQHMPEGYDTVVGGRSIRMSGGQRQRIGLARALLGQKRLVILDEATSALDSESERQVLQAIEGLRGKVTIIMIAHRLSTLKRADRILVFESGRIVEAGSFEALLQRNGAFSRLWNMQTSHHQLEGERV